MNKKKKKRKRERKTKEERQEEEEREEEEGGGARGRREKKTKTWPTTSCLFVCLFICLLSSLFSVSLWKSDLPGGVAGALGVNNGHQQGAQHRHLSGHGHQRR